MVRLTPPCNVTEQSSLPQHRSCQKLRPILIDVEPKDSIPNTSSSKERQTWEPELDVSSNIFLITNHKSYNTTVAPISKFPNRCPPSQLVPYKLIFRYGEDTYFRKIYLTG